MGFRDFLENSVRVFRLIRKPTKEEFIFVSKVAGIGMILIGFVGFIVELIGFFLFR